MASTATPVAQKEALKKVMVSAFMSSEESGEDIDYVDGETVKKAVLLLKPLQWRSHKLDRIFKQLDRKSARKKSKQSRQQTLSHVLGPHSTRPKPEGFAADFFGFSEK